MLPGYLLPLSMGLPWKERYHCLAHRNSPLNLSLPVLAFFASIGTLLLAFLAECL